MKTLTTLLLVAIASALNGQNVTIDYQSWTPANPTCSLFVAAT